MSVARWLPVFLGASAYLAFAIGMWRVFERGHRPTLGLRVIQLCAPLAAVAEVWAMTAARDAPAWRAAAGAVLFVLSLALFFSAAASTRRRKLTLAFSHDVPLHVHARGPFRWMRHPLYASYLLAYLAGAVVSANAMLLPVVAWMGAIYVLAARAEERKFKQSPVAREYAAYSKRTGMFWPRPWSGRLLRRKWATSASRE